MQRGQGLTLTCLTSSRVVRCTRIHVGRRKTWLAAATVTIQKVEWCSALAATTTASAGPPGLSLGIIDKRRVFSPACPPLSVEIENTLPAVWNFFRVFQRKVCHAVRSHALWISTAYLNIVSNRHVLIHMMPGICLQSVTCTVLRSPPHSSVFPATFRNL